MKEHLINVTGLQLAILFHKVYEELAPSFGYETREDTREFDASSDNGRLMVATCERILDELQKQSND